MGDRAVQKPRQHRAEVFSDADGADAMQIVEGPDDAGRAKIETGVTVPNPIVTRVRRPERVQIEMGDRIGRDVFDRSTDSRFTPCVTRQRTMTTENDHEGLLRPIHPAPGTRPPRIAKATYPRT